nr:hypothetical protein [Tanacetum cinerariifolium]
MVGRGRPPHNARRIADRGSDVEQSGFIHSQQSHSLSFGIGIARSRVKETGGVRKLQSSRLERQYSRTSLFQEKENDAGHVRAPSSSGLAAASSVNT